MAKNKAATKQERAARGRPANVVAPDQWPANTVELWRVEKLKRHPENVRLHPVGQLAALDESFAEHGVVRPFVINTDGFILAGNGSCDSVEHLHGKGVTVPCVVVRGWTKAQELAFMLRDNATAERSSWDKPALGIQLAQLKGVGYPDASKLGFKPAIVKKLAPEVGREGFQNADDAPPAQVGAAVSRPGDMWCLGDHRLMCGDATIADHVAILLAGDKPNLMVTDQPYGVAYDPDWRNRAADELNLSTGDAMESTARALGEVANDDRADWRAAFALFPGDVAYVWCASLLSPECIAALEACDFERRYLVVWNKHQHTIGRGHYHWKHEVAWYAVRRGANGSWQGSRSENTVWDIEGYSGGGSASKRDTDTGHGTQKPIECMARPMRNNSKPGDYVYEPFSGSGTTIIAGETLGRHVLAMEILPAYVDVGVNRWEGFTKKSAILAATGETFAAVAAARKLNAAPQS